MDKNTGERIKLIIQTFYSSNKEFAEEFGKSEQVVSNWVSRGASNKVLETILEKHQDISKSWLFLGEGEMRKFNKIQSFIIPCIPLRAEAGTLSGYTDSVMPYDSYSVASPVKDADFAVDIHGDSMEPEYPSGCRVFVQKVKQENLKVGFVYVIDTTEGIILKEIVSINNDSITYHSLNPKYKDETIKFSNIHKNGIYRVLGCLTFK